MSVGESATTYEDSLLWTLEEINRLVAHSGSPAETLTNVVQLIQRRFQTDVCSVYLLEPDRTNLVLAAWLVLRNSPPLWHRIWLAAGILTMQLLSLGVAVPQLLWDVVWLAMLALGAARAGSVRNPNRVAGAATPSKASP